MRRASTYSIMRRPRLHAASMVVALSWTAPGCLSLGGTTTHVHEDPELKSRVQLLERRVASLENAVGSSPQEASVESP
jgi:hypothetical protein